MNQLADTAKGSEVPDLMVFVILEGAVALGYVAYARNRFTTPRGIFAGAATVGVAVAAVAFFVGSTSLAVAALFTAAILGAVACS